MTLHLGRRLALTVSLERRPAPSNVTNVAAGADDAELVRFSRHPRVDIDVLRAEGIAMLYGLRLRV